MDLTDIKSDMQFGDAFWHFANFVLPALVMAPGMVLAARLVYRNTGSALSLSTQVAINFVVCLAVLLAGLAGTGHDGRLLTYAALVLASAATQAVLAARRPKSFSQG
jgi:hypothetical protein